MKREADFFDTPSMPDAPLHDPSPIADTVRIFALPTRAAREAALLELTLDRCAMVSHFLVAKFAAELNRTGSREALLAGVPVHMVDDVRRLARSYAESARIVKSSRETGADSGNS